MKLFEPVKIGRMELKNRIVMAPMSCNMSDNGFFTDQSINFYTARARGGVGLITCEDGIVDYPLGNNTKEATAMDDDKYIPILKKLNHSVHQYGAKTVMQLSHAGRRAGRIAKSGYLEVTRGKIPVAPSSIAHPVPGFVVPRELTLEEIKLIIEMFARAAKRSIEAGFDAIGLHCAHMYLCGQFLSPWANKRTDQYGGNLENRLKFVLDTIARIREEIGQDYPIIVRMNGQEPEGGNSLAEIRQIARSFELAGVDAIHVSVGFAATLKDPDFIPSIAPMRFPDGPIVHLAENVKKAVSIPVIAVNKIRSAAFAEYILQNESADLIALGRTLVAEPDFVPKALEGKHESIRPCISCCIGCIGRVSAGLPLSCAVNPMAGREEEYGITLAPVKKKVAVIGGGPGGMEAATVAAQRGHRVVLYEKQPKLGGLLKDASLPPHKSEINKLIDFYTKLISTLNIEVNLNSTATPELISASGYDVVIMASGGHPVKHLPIPGIDGENVVIATDVLKHNDMAGKEVLIIGGGQVGLEVADYLAVKGKKVAIVEMLDEVALDMPSQNRLPLILQLERYGVNILTLTRVKKILNDSVIVSGTGDEAERIIKADTVILAVGYQADQVLVDSFKGSAPEIYAVGNCVNPGNILEAIHQGFATAMNI